MKAASSDLGVVRQPDVKADVTVVTGYVALPRHPRSEKEYGELAAKVFTPLCKSFRVRAFYEPLDACWLWRVLEDQKVKISHSVADNPKKNSRAYHCVVHQKFEWLLRAAIDDSEADTFIWLDYGIAHVQGVSAGLIEEFLRSIRKNDFAIPGCWSKDQLVIGNLDPCWRFCGGVLVVPRKHLLMLYNAVRNDVIEQLATTRNVCWEVNTLARIESGLPVRWYQADLDGSMFRNYGELWRPGVDEERRDILGEETRADSGSFNESFNASGLADHSNHNRVDAMSTGHRALPKTYCIVCPQLPQRRALAEAHFRERGLEVELFAGIHGPTWGLETKKTRADDNRMSSGHVGLLMSHWLLWRVAEKLNDEEILIFEDDVILPPDFRQEFQRSYKQLPADWQFVFVGFLGRFPSQHVVDRISIVRYPYGLHAYLVKRTALRTLIETNQEARTHLDLQLIENTLPRLKCYTFTPSLAGQRTYEGQWPTSAGEPLSSAKAMIPAVTMLDSDAQIARTMISLHDQVAELRYPETLRKYIDLLFSGETRSCTKSTGPVISVRETGPDRFAISGNVNWEASDELSTAELLDVLLEEVTRSLICKLETGLALHAACTGWQGKSVLIVGPTGAGKTSLVGWLISRNFHFLSDELVILPQNRTTALSFPRPLLAKSGSEELITILARAGHNRAVQTAAHTMICLDQSSYRDSRESEAGLIIFPKFVAGGRLELAPMSPAMTCLKLMECNLNARNLADHGLAALAALARRLPALSLTYGNYQQLDGVLDNLAKLVLENHATIADLRKLASAFLHSPVMAPGERIQSVNSSSLSDVARVTIPAATPRKQIKQFTIGMATYDDYDGVYFTLQSIRLYHPEILDEVEFIVIDNRPSGPCAAALKNFEGWIPNYRYIPVPEPAGTAVRDFVFQEASGTYVLCLDCHVLIVNGAIKRLFDYFNVHADTKDLLQGPMIYDDLKNYSTHFKPVWQGGMYGVWDTNPAAKDPDEPPFEIAMQGLGLFACRREVWPGFNPGFRGFGGEEGYIHEKFRRRGGRALCLPFLRWMHRFSRPLGTQYANVWEDRVRNYLIGFRELGWNTAPVIEHFRMLLGKEDWDRVAERLGTVMLSSDNEHIQTNVSVET